MDIKLYKILKVLINLEKHKIDSMDAITLIENILYENIRYRRSHRI